MLPAAGVQGEPRQGPALELTELLFETLFETRPVACFPNENKTKALGDFNRTNKY
jgi:hypothetical protein